MAIAVEMPKMSDTMEEGVLAAWLKEEGQPIAAGDVVAQVETDKATMDLEVYDDGVLLKRVIGEGDAVPIGGLIAILGKEGEDISAILAKYQGGGAAPAPAAAPAAVEEAPAAVAEAPAAAPAASDDSRVKASPLARKLAADHGVNLAGLAGSGPEGRIVKRDVEAAMGGASAPAAASAPAPAAAPAPAETPRPAVQAPAAPVTVPGGTYDAVRISQMRKTIARRLAESKFTNPHFYLTADIDMSEAVAFRGKLNEKAEANGLAKVSFNDLVTKACALGLRQHPWVNASWMEAEGEIRLHHDVHVAIAVAIEDGLVTPVIRNADRKGLSQLAAETRSLAERARNRELQPEDWSGSTFSTSNLGMFGIDEFTAIINPPNACILAIGSIRDVPVVKNGVVVPGKQMKVTLSCDHRVVDGATGAEFLKTVRGYLEDPVTMLL
ncbi:MAG: pyruvate dehydrogenase complex dihydrolipoamide acetyltransferase [Bacteroidetes bacterium]|nr:pyruvate dehydrogenase complex dihydrolipoamide acetyltransferase [Bacteroidota bacterium]